MGAEKNDRLDAENLARLARLDPKLLSPLKHRGEASQAHMALLRSREALVGVRTKLINHVRGAVKSFGARLPKCSAGAFPNKAAPHVPDLLRSVLEPMLETVASLTARIREYDRQLETLSRKVYPETELLRQVGGVGPITALAFVLVLEDPSRLANSRMVGTCAGLVPAEHQSGDRATRTEAHLQAWGRGMLRRLLVGAAQYILGPFARDSDLRRHGLKIAERGGNNAKKRAVVAVARKLSVLLHRLWITGEVYELLYNAERCGEAAA